MALTKALLTARVMHARQRPRRHSFTYGVYYLCFSLSDIGDLPNRLLSVDKWNLFSFYNRDHGPRDHGKRERGSLEQWMRAVLAEHEVSADGDITLLTLPRVLGYVFNPVSFWFCRDKAGGLRAVLSEVCNTFGERHCYLSLHDDRRPIEPQDWLKAKKLFHVSPFLDVTGHYEFRFACDDDKVNVIINYHDADGLMLATSLIGQRQPLTARTLATHFFRYPLITFKVIALIHGEALRLILKGARYRPKPPPPPIEVSR
jgi:DUF1365 family protein